MATSDKLRGSVLDEPQSSAGIAASRRLSRPLVLAGAALALVVGGLITATLRGRIPAAFPAGKWQLAWSDEFSGSSLDRAKWNVRDEAGKYNHELQYYAPDGVAVRAGCLRLNSQRRLYARRFYTSGAVDTKGKYFFLYGRVEVRARLPRGQGVWPACWLLPEDGSWPPEIDVMELLGQEPTALHMTNYWGTLADHHLNSGLYIGPDFSQGWHTYAVEWEPGGIRWYVDGTQEFISTEGVPDKPMYLILNTAIGGDFAGSPVKSTPLPQHYDIDYVRVWQRH
jgi:beta-glucanase (GH16 family)